MIGSTESFPTRHNCHDSYCRNIQANSYNWSIEEVEKPLALSKTLEKALNRSSKTKHTTLRTAITSAAIGRIRRRLLPCALVAVVLCLAGNRLSILAQPPVLPPSTAQLARHEQPIRRSPVQAPKPQRPPNMGRPLVGRPAPQSSDDPGQLQQSAQPPLEFRQRTAASVQRQLVPPTFSQQVLLLNSAAASPARYAQSPVHVYPDGVTPELRHEFPMSSAANVIPQAVWPSGGHAIDRQPQPSSIGSLADSPVHVYPEGFEVTEESAGHVPATFVAAQELFAPPINAPELPASGPGGHSRPSELSTIIIPGPAAASTNIPEQIIAQAPDVQPTVGTLWWEADLSKNILPGREAFPLTLPQALGRAMQEAPELQVLHSDWFIQQVEVERQLGAFDWTTFVNAIWNRDSTPVGSDLDGAANRLRSRTSSVAAGARRLNEDGSEFEISQTVGTQNSNSDFINPNNQGTSRLGVEYQKPLLRGGGEDYNLSRVQLAEIQKDTAYDRFRIGVQDHLLDVASAYWTLVLQRGRFVQSVKSWHRAQAIERAMASRTEIDVTPNMLDRTRSEVATRLANAIESEHDTMAAQDGLLRLIYGSKYLQYADQEVVTMTLPMKDGNQMSADTHVQDALRNRSEVHQSIREIKAASVSYEVAANEVLPQLDMVLTGYVAGLRGNNDVGGSIVNQFTEGEPGVGIGFNFEIPYHNRAAEAAAEQNLIAIKRMRAQLEVTIGEVTENVRGQVIQRNKFGTVLTQQMEALVRTKRIVDYIQKRREFRADGSNVADLYLENLLQQQSRLETAELRYLRSQVQFSLADTALLRAIAKLDTIAEGGASCGICGDGLTAENPHNGVEHATSQQPVEDAGELVHPGQVTAASARIER